MQSNCFRLDTHGTKWNLFTSFSANFQQCISWKPVLDLKLLNDWQADTQTQRFCLNYMLILCGCYKECAKTFVFWHSDTTGGVMKHNIKLKGFWNERNKWEHVSMRGKPGVKNTKYCYVDKSFMLISASLFHLICELLVLIRCISLVTGASRVMLVYLIVWPNNTIISKKLSLMVFTFRQWPNLCCCRDMVLVQQYFVCLSTANSVVHYVALHCWLADMSCLLFLLTQL